MVFLIKLFSRNQADSDELLLDKLVFGSTFALEVGSGSGSNVSFEFDSNLSLAFGVEFGLFGFLLLAACSFGLAPFSAVCFFSFDSTLSFVEHGTGGGLGIFDETLGRFFGQQDPLHDGGRTLYDEAFVTTIDLVVIFDGGRLQLPKVLVACESYVLFFVRDVEHTFGALDGVDGLAIRVHCDVVRFSNIEK